MEYLGYVFMYLLKGRLDDWQMLLIYPFGSWMLLHNFLTISFLSYVFLFQSSLPGTQSWHQKTNI